MMSGMDGEMHTPTQLDTQQLRRALGGITAAVQLDNAKRGAAKINDLMRRLTIEAGKPARVPPPDA